MSGAHMNMANKKLSPELVAELARLSLLTEDDIDRQDMPEVADWSAAKRGMFSREQILERHYDVRALANWLLDQGRALGQAFSNMSLNKLIYFAFERSLVERNILLTSARVEAWDHGPVFREVYQAFKAAGDNPIQSPALRFSLNERKMVKAEDAISDEDRNFLEDILRRYGYRTASQLRTLSHLKGGPWHTVWHYRGRSNPGMEITVPIIYSHARLSRDVNED